MIKKILICLLLFTLCASTVGAVWYANNFGGKVTIPAPPPENVTWYSSSFGGKLDMYGWTEWSPYWNITMAENNPPTNFTSSVYSTTAINLTWDKDPDSITTRIVRKQGSAPSSFPDGGTIIYNSSGETHDDTGLHVGTLYGYGAWSWNGNNSVDFVTTTCYTLPGDPSSLTNISLGSHGVLLGWTKGTNATYTLIIMNNSGIASYPTTPYDGIEKYNGTNSQATISGLQPNMTYYFSAFGYINDLDGYHSTGYSTHNCTTLESTDDPTDLRAYPYNDSVMNLVWYGGAYPTVIVRKEGSYPINQSDGIEVYNNSGFSAQDIGLHASHHYYYRAWGWTGAVYTVNYTSNNNYTLPHTPDPTTTYSLDTNLTINWTNTFTIFRDDFEGDLNNWTLNGWEKTSGQKANGSYSIVGYDDDGDLTSDIINTSICNKINISFWYRDDDCSTNDLIFKMWNGTALNTIQDLSLATPEDTWHYYEYETTDTSYMTDDFYILFDNNMGDSFKTFWIDDILIKAVNDNENYIVRKSTIYWVNAPDEGTGVYSGSGDGVVDPYITSMVYYSIWAYSTESGYYSRQHNITWGGLAINCHNESDASQNLTFDLFVTNEEGTETYVAYNLTNTYYIDVDDLPTGNKTVVQISASGYKTRYYYMDLFPNAFYLLDAYLPIKDPTGEGGGWGADNQSYALLYLFSVVNYYSDPVDSAKVTVQRYIPQDDEYKPVTILYTDASGQCSLYLLPENIYKIQIEATGYNTEYVDFIPDPDIRTHTFRLDFIDITDDTTTEQVLDGISFTVQPYNHYWTGNFTVYFNITSSDSQLEWFRASFYKWNSSELTWDLLYSENNSVSPSGGSISYFISNNTGKYKMDAYFKKENFAEYEIIQTSSTIWFISWGGIAGSGLTDAIPGFVWLLVAIVLTAILMGFFMPIAGLGTGYIGIGFLGFCMLLKPDLMLSDGTTGWMILAIVTLVYTLALFLWSRL